MSCIQIDGLELGAKYIKTELQKFLLTGVFFFIEVFNKKRYC